MKFSRSTVVTLAVIFLINSFTISLVEAHDGFGDFPYEGTYLTDEDQAIRGFTFDTESQSITILTQQSSQNEDIRRLSEIRNSGNHTALIDPFISAEEINDMREKWGLDDIDYSKILLEAADKVEPWMTRKDAMKLAFQEIPGVHSLSDIDSDFNSDILISKPEILQSQDLWIVGIMGDPRILRFEMNESTDSITDEYGIVYTLEEGNQNE